MEEGLRIFPHDCQHDHANEVCPYCQECTFGMVDEGSLQIESALVLGSTKNTTMDLYYQLILERQERQMQHNELWRFLCGLKEHMQMDRDDFDTRVKQVTENLIYDRTQDLVKQHMQKYRQESFGHTKHQGKAVHDEMYMDISGMVKEINDDLVNDKLQEVVRQNLERIPGLAMSDIKRVNTELVKCQGRLDEIEREVSTKTKNLNTKLTKCERRINECVEEQETQSENNVACKKEISRWRTQVDMELKKYSEWLSTESPKSRSRR